MSGEQSKSNALAENARLEAAAFELPPDWQQGRELRTGYAIDAAYSLDKDDTVSVSTDQSGNRVLHGSIADVGTFTADQPAIQELAKHRVFSTYRNFVAMPPMFPYEISEDKLSLLDNGLRPAITTHLTLDTLGHITKTEVSLEKLQAIAVTPQQIDRLLASENPPADIRELQIIARQFGQIRSGDPDEALIADELRAERALPGTKASDMLMELMVGINSAMAAFVLERNIPVPLRRHDLIDYVPGEPLRARYTTNPIRHIGLNVPLYMHWTSPLRRRPDDIAHLNVSAYLHGKPLPLSREAIELELPHINEVARRQKTGAMPQPRKPTGRLKPTPMSGAGMLERIEKGTVNERDLAHALFVPLSGGRNQAEQAKTRAAMLMADRRLIHQVMEIALSKQWLKPSPNITPGLFLLADREGNEYEYDPRAVKSERIAYAANILTSISGVRIDHEQPRIVSREQKVLARPFMYLDQLRQATKLPLRFTMHRGEEGLFNLYDLTLTAFVFGELHQRHTIGFSLAEAYDDVSLQLITDLEIYKRPLIPSDYHTNPAASPIGKLHRWIRSEGLPTCDYTFDSRPEPVRHNRCSVSVYGFNGTRLVASALGTNKRHAQQQAAQKMLEAVAPDLIAA